MNKTPGLLPIAILMLTATLAVWLGLGGPLLSEATAKGWYDTLKDWQALIGVAGAFAIGYIAVRPVWRQVHIQAAQTAMQLLPDVEAEYASLNRDKTIIATARVLARKLRLCERSIQRSTQDRAFDIGNFIVDSLADVEVFASGVKQDDWLDFTSRLHLAESHRAQRWALRDMVTFRYRDIADAHLGKKLTAPNMRQKALEVADELAAHDKRIVYTANQIITHARGRAGSLRERATKLRHLSADIG